MNYLKAHIILAILVLITVATIQFASATRLLVHRSNNCDAFPVDSIDSILFQESQYTIYCKDACCKTYDGIDSLAFADIVGDTIKLVYCDKTVHVYNGRADIIDVATNDSNADVKIAIKTTAFKSITNPIIAINGESSDGRLLVASDIAYTLCLNGIKLSSSHAPAFNSTGKSAINIKLGKNTVNTFGDAAKYVLDNNETANGCFSALGAFTFSGNGQLTVEGNMKHAIYSKKSITFNGGIISVDNAKSDAIHSSKNVTVNGGQLMLRGMLGDGIDTDDDFSLTGGKIEMDITGEAAKGIKCGGIMNISGGKITATASGALKNTDGDLSYCTILKCDSDMTISGGDFHLVNNSPGGKCISADHDLTITGGTIYTETNGNGAEYTNAEGVTDYYTSKCIAADDSLFMHRGNIQCLSTGIGGKGIVADGYMEIGLSTDTAYTQGPTITVETTDSSIVNDVDEDKRYGCPKAIKVNNIFNIYSGDIHCTTAGMGGEGIECNKEMYVYGGNIECNTFDDGINVGGKLDVFDGSIYCNSIDNDGIDSNGKITLLGGVVIALNQGPKNESFDSESDALYFYGGTVFGVGCQRVHLQECIYPCYNSVCQINADGTSGSAITLEKDKYIYIMEGDTVLMALKSTLETNSGYITVTNKNFVENGNYRICLGNQPVNSDKSYFNGKFTIGGVPVNEHEIYTFIAK